MPRPGPALELGTGRGRVALPLAAMGVQVHGIDASAAIVERLRAKPGGEAIDVTVGDFAAVPVEGRYPLVYGVFNTYFAPLTQDDQLRCFAAVGRRLAPGGAFVLQEFVPDQSLHPGGQSVRTTHLGLDQVRLDLARHPAVPGGDPLCLAVRARPWPGWPGCGCVRAGAAGAGSRSVRTAASTCRSTSTPGWPPRSMGPWTGPWSWTTGGGGWRCST